MIHELYQMITSKKGTALCASFMIVVVIDMIKYYQKKYHISKDDLDWGKLIVATESGVIIILFMILTIIQCF